MNARCTCIPTERPVYFASNGLPGCGGFDLFSGHLAFSRGIFRIDRIKNITGVNTFRNESFPLYSVFNSDTAYFTFMKNGKPSVYEISLPQHRPEPVAYLEVKIFDAETKQPVLSDAKMIRLNDRTSGITLASSTDNHGSAQFAVRRNTGYTITITAEGYVYRSEAVEIGGNQDFVKKDYFLEKGKVRKGYTLSMESIYFDYGSAQIRDDSQQGA